MANQKDSYERFVPTVPLQGGNPRPSEVREAAQRQAESPPKESYYVSRDSEEVIKSKYPKR